MKAKLALILASALFLSPAGAHDSTPHPEIATDPGISGQAQPAVAVVEQFSAALQAADFQRVSDLLADDVLILESGGAERSREEYLGHHAIADALFLKAAHVAVKRRTARVEGPFAWVGTESELHATQDGKPMSLLSTETMILKKAGNDWRIVHIHWSSRPKKATASDTAQ
jgi:uncharacterized protein (TIGR02246 family)